MAFSINPSVEITIVVHFEWNIDDWFNRGIQSAWHISSL